MSKSKNNKNNTKMKTTAKTTKATRFSFVVEVGELVPEENANTKRECASERVPRKRRTEPTKTTKTKCGDEVIWDGWLFSSFLLNQ